MKNKWMDTKNKSPSKRGYFFTMGLATLCLSGCMPSVLGGYGANGLSHEEFVHYVEGVFRFQNKMTSEVMVLSDSGDTPPDLLQAENHMRRMCAHLNEYVSRDIDGLYKGFLLRRRVENSAADCDKAAQALQALLKED